MPNRDLDYPGDPISISNPPRWSPRRYEIALHDASMWMRTPLGPEGAMYWKGVRDALWVLSGVVTDWPGGSSGPLRDLNTAGPGVRILLRVQDMTRQEVQESYSDPEKT